MAWRFKLFCCCCDDRRRHSIRKHHVTHSNKSSRSTLLSRSSTENPLLARYRSDQLHVNHGPCVAVCGGLDIDDPTLTSAAAATLYRSSWPPRPTSSTQLHWGTMPSLQTTGSTDIGGDSTPGCWPSDADDCAMPIDRSSAQGDENVVADAGTRTTSRCSADGRMMTSHLTSRRPPLTGNGSGGCMCHGVHCVPHVDIAGDSYEQRQRCVAPPTTVGSAVDLLRSTTGCSGYCDGWSGEPAATDNLPRGVASIGCSSCVACDGGSSISWSSLPRRTTDLSRVNKSRGSDKSNVIRTTASVTSVGPQSATLQVDSDRGQHWQLVTNRMLSMSMQLWNGTNLPSYSDCTKLLP